VGKGEIERGSIGGPRNIMAKILIVDDEPQATTLLEMLLSSRGYKTVAVNESSEAIQVARETDPDLIILDLMMPEPDGFKVCRMLRADSRFMLTPILIITALDDTDSRIVAFGAGADDYLIKPYNVDELVSIIKALLHEEIGN
jgi:DNA-binding response OmpR family regulator